MTRTFDDVTDVKSVENPIPDDHFNGIEAASSGNNDLNRLYCHMDHQYLINPCVNEQSEGLLFSDLMVHSLRTISKNFVQYLRILLSSLGKEDF